MSVGLLAACGEDAYPYMGDDEGPDARPRPDGPDGSPGPDGDPGPDAASNDGMPPTFTLIDPTIGEMVAGVITLTVDIDDADGVDPDSVIATIAGTHTIEMTSGGGRRWTGTFDTVPLAGLVFPTIVVRAADDAGNMGQLGFEIVLDNEAPIASLDPPHVREAEMTADGLACSRSFDPVGDDAADDLQRILQLTAFRARVQDVGNTGTMTTSVFVPNARVASVELYVLDDTTKPLVVDTDGNGSCDDINPKITPTSVPSSASDAAVVDLTPLAASGNPYYPASMSGDPFTGSNASCGVGDDAQAPAQLCAFADATRIPEVPAYHLPMIYTIPPAEEPACMGYGFDALASNITDGWACVAIRAVDTLGNVRVSAPIRVCVDSNDDSSAPCGTLATPPTCTGTYVAATDTVNNTACTPRVIPSPAGGGHELLRTDL